MNDIIIIAAILILVILFALWMHHEMNCLGISFYSVESVRLPDNFNGLKFVLLSDLHNKSFGEKNVRLIQAIDRQKPDFIVIAGDMVTYGKKNGLGYIAGLELIKELKERYDVFYAPGNHEEELKKEDPSYERKVREAGIYYVNNESVMLKRGEQAIRIAGLSLPMEYFRKFHNKQLEPGTVEALLGSKKSQHYTLLIAHKPAHFAQYQSWGADLVVSGHLHGGLINVPHLGGFVSPQLEFFPKFDAGKFILEDSTMIISRGLGSHSIPIRINNRPEIVVVTLKQLKN